MRGLCSRPLASVARVAIEAKRHRVAVSIFSVGCSSSGFYGYRVKRNLYGAKAHLNLMKICY